MNWEWFYKIFEGELLVMFWSIFLLQIVCQLCYNLKDFIKIVRLLFAAVSICALSAATTHSRPERISHKVYGSWPASARPTYLTSTQIVDSGSRPLTPGFTTTTKSKELESPRRMIAGEARVTPGCIINPLMLTAAKSVWQFWSDLSCKSIIAKIFEGELLNRILQTTLLQIFCKIIFNSQVIVKSNFDADDNF